MWNPNRTLLDFPEIVHIGRMTGCCNHRNVINPRRHSGYCVCCTFSYSEMLNPAHIVFLSFFLSYSYFFLPTHCRCSWLWLHLNTHTLGRTPLDEWSARRRDLYLTTHSTHKRQPSMPLEGFEPAIPASERPQTHALDRAVTGICPRSAFIYFICFSEWLCHYFRKQH